MALTDAAQTRTVAGAGGELIVVEDRSGNPVELFEPTGPKARLSPLRRHPGAVLSFR